MKIRGIFALCVSLFGSAVSFAIVPDEHFLPKGVLDQVVRVNVGANDTFNGTGSVIGKILQFSGGQQVGWFLCVLTANHVVKNWDDVSIGFNNPGNPLSASLPAWVHAEGRNKTFGSPSNPEHPDLAILGVKVGRSTFIDNLVPLEVIDDTNVPVETSFTVAGYGNSGYMDDINGDHVPDGYREVNTPPVRRFANNRFDYKIKDTWGQWNHQAWEYDIDGPVPDVLGEGWPMRGDSGGPLLTYNPLPITVYGSEVRIIPAFTDKIVGVVSRGAAGWVPWGSKEYDVRITTEYKNWIHHECSTVPEPSAMIALTLGVATLLARKRAKR